MTSAETKMLNLFQEYKITIFARKHCDHLIIFNSLQESCGLIYWTKDKTTMIQMNPCGHDFADIKNALLKIFEIKTKYEI